MARQRSHPEMPDSRTHDNHRKDSALVPEKITESAKPCDGMMSKIQDNSHTFIARFWLEPREIKNAKPIWRGVVEHVASGQRRYLQDLDEVKAFLASYLQGKGILPQKKVAGKALK